MPGKAKKAYAQSLIGAHLPVLGVRGRMPDAKSAGAGRTRPDGLWLLLDDMLITVTFFALRSLDGV